MASARPLAAAAVADANPDDITIPQKMASAVLGSVLTSLLVTPLDVVRVRLQSQHPTPTLPRSTLPLSSFANLPPDLGISSCCREVFWVNNNAAYCVAAPHISLATPAAAAPLTTTRAAAECAAEEIQRRTYTSTLDGLRKIARNEGLPTLWRGLSPTLAMAVPANVIYFAGYDWLRTSSTSPLRRSLPDAYLPVVAGSFARILAAIAVGPIEIFRTRMQAAHTAPTPAGHFRETLHGLRIMVAQRGLPSLWTGLSLTLWRDVPFSAIYWAGYEALRNAFTDARETRHGRSRISRGPDALRLRARSRSRERPGATLVDSFAAGMIAGAGAALVTTPFDVGKTRQQVLRHGAAQAKAGAPEELSMPRFLGHIFREQGLSGLFKGWAARCLKVAPACAIMISSYEVGKRVAAGVNEREDSPWEGE
ncbi:mitochondrial carrier [Trichodelitschia bisporula]|uniref:Mitochondrial carrier n=1 Tax=Trichodelitschia bisporula TaxID=703511 RepID=A0A6G1HVH9_9PEZI|nr:mitochondrial carrier [Trichodelitschia bisporula]